MKRQKCPWCFSYKFYHNARNTGYQQAGCALICHLYSIQLAFQVIWGQKIGRRREVIQQKWWLSFHTLPASSHHCSLEGQKPLSSPKCIPRYNTSATLLMHQRCFGQSPPGALSWSGPLDPWPNPKCLSCSTHSASPQGTIIAISLSLQAPKSKMTLKSKQHLPPVQAGVELEAKSRSKF